MILTFYSIFMVLFLMAAIQDFLKGEVSHLITLSAFVLGILKLIYSFSLYRLYFIISVLLIFVVFFIFAESKSKGSIGGSDIKFYIITAMFLSWQQFLFFLIIDAIISTILAISQTISKKLKSTSTRYLPYMYLAFILTNIYMKMRN